MIAGPSMCLACTRLHHTAAVATCDAYPEGIPEEILDGASHIRERGDETGGLVFEAEDSPGARVVLDAWEAIHGPIKGAVGRPPMDGVETGQRSQLDDDELRLRGVIRAAGHDITPGHEQLHHYWTRGEGLAKWVGHPHPWTALRNHLVKYVGPERADRMASEWFHEVFGIWSGERKGKNPVGPG